MGTSDLDFLADVDPVSKYLAPATIARSCQTVVMDNVIAEVSKVSEDWILQGLCFATVGVGKPWSEAVLPCSEGVHDPLLPKQGGD